jgi:hypothetical protein
VKVKVLVQVKELVRVKEPEQVKVKVLVQAKERVRVPFQHLQLRYLVKRMVLALKQFVVKLEWVKNLEWVQVNLLGLVQVNLL